MKTSESVVWKIGNLPELNLLGLETLVSRFRELFLFQVQGIPDYWFVFTEHPESMVKPESKPIAISHVSNAGSAYITPFPCEGATEALLLTRAKLPFASNADSLKGMLEGVETPRVGTITDTKLVFYSATLVDPIVYTNLETFEKYCDEEHLGLLSSGWLIPNTFNPEAMYVVKDIPQVVDEAKKVDIHIDLNEQAQLKTKAFNVLVATSDSFMPARNQHGKYMILSEECAIRYIKAFNNAIGVALACLKEEHGAQLYCRGREDSREFMPTIRYDVCHKLIETQRMVITDAGIEIKETEPSVVLLKDAQVGDLVECISSWDGANAKFTKGKIYRLIPRAHDGQNLHEFSVMDQNGSPYPLQLNQRTFIKVFEANAFKANAVSANKEIRESVGCPLRLIDDSVSPINKSVNNTRLANPLDMSDKIEIRYRKAVDNGAVQLTVYIWYHKTNGLSVICNDDDLPVLNKGYITTYGVPMIDEVLGKAYQFMADNYSLSRLEKVKNNGTVLKFSAFK